MKVTEMNVNGQVNGHDEILEMKLIRDPDVKGQDELKQSPLEESTKSVDGTVKSNVFGSEKAEKSHSKLRFFKSRKPQTATDPRQSVILEKVSSEGLEKAKTSTGFMGIFKRHRVETPSNSQLKEISKLIEKDLNKLYNQNRLTLSQKEKMVNSRIKLLENLTAIPQISPNFRDKFQQMKDQLETFSEQMSSDSVSGEVFATDLTPVINRISHAKTRQVSNDKPLTKSELQLLVTLSQYLTAEKKGEDPILTPDEKTRLGNLFKNMIGNMAVNRQMNELAKKGKLKQLGITSNVADIVKEFTFRTKNIENIQTITRRTQTLIEKTRLGEIIMESEKLSLKEIGTLDSFPKAKYSVRLILKLDLQEESSELKQLIKDYKECSAVKDQIEFKLNKYSNNKSGDLIFQDYDKLCKYRQITQDFDDKQQTWALGLPLHHAAVSVKIDGEDKISHILDEYEYENFALRDKATMSCYRLDPTKLLTSNPQMQNLINEMYISEGTDAITGLRNMYQDIQTRLHTKMKQDPQGEFVNRFTGLKSSIKRRRDSGIAEIFERLHLGRHKPNQFKELRTELSSASDFNSKEMICSEFAAKTLLTAIMEQEEELYIKLVDYLVSKRGMPVQQARALVGAQPLFQLPVSDREVLRKINPTRFLKLLTNHKCITKIEPHPLLKGLLKAEELASPSGERVFRTTHASGFNRNEIELEKMIPKQEIAELEEVKPVLPENPSIRDKWAEHNDLANTIIALKQNSSQIYYQHIADRRKEIAAAKEEWRAKIDANDSEFKNQVYVAHEKGSLIPVQGGMGGAYLLKDENGIPRFIVKPSDEDILALNNRKKLATPYNNQWAMHRVRRDIPLYTTVQTEVLAYKVAESLGFENITPQTEMVILKNEQFHDITDNTQEMNGDRREKTIQKYGMADREKLCSAQQFIPDSKELMEFANELELVASQKDLAPSQLIYMMEKSIDPKDFEDAVIFNCIIGETDGNPGNFRVYEKYKDEDSNPVMGIKKVDNALSFADKNTEFYNCLNMIPLIKNKLSEKSKQKILDINEDEITALMKAYNKSENAIKAFKERIELLKELAKMNTVRYIDLNKSIEKMRNHPRAKMMHRKNAAENKQKSAFEKVDFVSGTVVDSGTVVNLKDEKSLDSGTIVIQENTVKYNTVQES